MSSTRPAVDAALEYQFTRSDLRALVLCYDFAAQKHKGQKRKDPEGTPYINHPIGVSRILMDEGGVYDLSTIMAGILHDTVEDTDATFDELELNFGKHVRSIVEECTDDKSLPWQERKRLQVETASSKSLQAKRVKLADKLYNLRDLERVFPKGWSEERVKQYFIWAKQVCQGLQGACPQLEAKLEEMFQRRGL